MTLAETTVPTQAVIERRQKTAAAEEPWGAPGDGARTWFRDWGPLPAGVCPDFLVVRFMAWAFGGFSLDSTPGGLQQKRP